MTKLWLWLCEMWLSVTCTQIFASIRYFKTQISSCFVIKHHNTDFPDLWLCVCLYSFTSCVSSAVIQPRCHLKLTEGEVAKPEDMRLSNESAVSWLILSTDPGHIDRTHSRNSCSKFFFFSFVLSGEMISDYISKKLRRKTENENKNVPDRDKRRN